MNDEFRTATKEASAIVDEVKPLLAGKTSIVQGLALTELVAIYLAGHFLHDDTGKVDRKETTKLRKAMMANFTDTAIKLMPIVEREILAEIRKGAS